MLFPEIRFWISLLVYWAAEFPNWLRNNFRGNSDMLDYGLDGKEISIIHHFR